MTRIELSESAPPLDLIAELVTHHGAVRVLRAWIAATRPKRLPPPGCENLSNHMRRDIGLQPMPEPAPSLFWR